MFQMKNFHSLTPYNALANYRILVFSIFDTFVLPSKFQYFGKALDASKVGLSDRITAGWSIWKSNFPQNVTSNVIFNLPEGQPTHSLSFSIFDTFDLPSKILCFSKALKVSKVGSSEGITAGLKIWKLNFAQIIIWNFILGLHRVNLPIPRLFRFLTFLSCHQIFMPQWGSKGV